MRGGRGGRLFVAAVAVTAAGVLLAACGKPAPPSSPATTVVGSATTAAGGTGAAFSGAKQVDAEQALAAIGQKAKGGPVGALSYDDANGANLLVLSQTEEQKPSKLAVGGPGDWVTVYAQLFTTAGGQTRLVRTVSDGVQDCTVDNEVKFTSDKAEASDLDRDGVGEVLFGYTVGCHGDISPVELKLLLLEGGDKYIVRGETYTGPGQGKEAGGRLPSGKPDPGWSNWPKGTQALVTKRWDQVAIRQ